LPLLDFLEDFLEDLLELEQGTSTRMVARALGWFDKVGLLDKDGLELGCFEIVGFREMDGDIEGIKYPDLLELVFELVFELFFELFFEDLDP